MVFESLAVENLTESQEKELAKIAVKARQNAYCPYSKYFVGSALLAKNGQVFQGCNFENASYGLCICAERAALGNAIVNGCLEFLAIAVVTKDGKAFPCGACRQCLNEFSPEMRILTVNPDAKIIHRVPLSELFPKAFGPHNL